MIEKPTKDQLLKLIREIEDSPNDRVRILADAGIATLGVGIGAAAAGTVAAAIGVTSIWGVTTAASWVGISAVAATPVGWILGCAAVAGACVYGISRLVLGGGLAEGRKAELLQIYQQELRAIEAKERANNVTDADKNRLITSMRELIEKGALLPEIAKRLIEQVEAGRIPISVAIVQIQSILSTAKQ